MSPRAKAVEYAWKEGATERVGVAADLVAQVVNDEIDTVGVCHPQALVDKARPARSPLHNLFDWDNESAANKHRLWQARTVIGGLRVVVDDYPVPAFTHVSVVVHDGVIAGYERTEVALRERDTRVQMITAASRSLLALRRRYRDLDELKPVWVLLDEVLAEYDT